MLTEDGPKDLEFNARFGDPGTQDVAQRAWKDDRAVSVVLTSAGYPGHYEKGKVITGIEKAEELEGVTVYHAGTAIDAAGNIITNGGRVLDVTAVAPTFEAARAQAYAACALIDFEGKTCRTDIGLKATKTRADM